MSEQIETSAVFAESPASWNTRYIDPRGFVCQLTLRAESGRDLLDKAKSAMTYLIEEGCTPYCYTAGSHSKKDATSNENDPAWCPIHETRMKKRERDGQVWHSHKATNGWCNGKAKEKE